MDKLANIAMSTTGWTNFFPQVSNTSQLKTAMAAISDGITTALTSVTINPETGNYEEMLDTVMSIMKGSITETDDGELGKFSILSELIYMLKTNGFRSAKDLCAKYNIQELLTSSQIDMIGMAGSFKTGAKKQLVPYILESDAAECFSDLSSSLSDPPNEFGLTPVSPIRCLLKSTSSRNVGLLVIMLPRLTEKKFENTKLVFVHEVIIVPADCHLTFFEECLNISSWYVGRDLPFNADVAFPIFVDFKTRVQVPQIDTCGGSILRPMPVELSEGPHVVASPVGAGNNAAVENASPEDRILIDAAVQSDVSVIEYPYFWKGYGSSQKPKKRKLELDDKCTQLKQMVGRKGKMPPKNTVAKSEHTIYYDSAAGAVTTTLEFMINVEWYKGSGKQNLDLYKKFFKNTPELFTKAQTGESIDTILEDALNTEDYDPFELDGLKTKPIKITNVMRKSLPCIPVPMLMSSKIHPSWWCFVETAAELSTYRLPRPYLIAACKTLAIEDLVGPNGTYENVLKSVSKFKATMIGPLIAAGGVHWTRIDKDIRNYLCKLLKINEKMETNPVIQTVTSRCRFGFTKKDLVDPDALVSLIHKTAGRLSTITSQLTDPDTFKKITDVKVIQQAAKTPAKKRKSPTESNSGEVTQPKSKKVKKSSANKASIEELLSRISELEAEKQSLLVKNTDIPTDLPDGTVVVIPVSPESDDDDDSVPFDPQMIADISDSDSDDDLPICNQTSGNIDGSVLLM